VKDFRHPPSPNPGRGTGQNISQNENVPLGSCEAISFIPGLFLFQWVPPPHPENKLPVFMMLRDATCSIYKIKRALFAAIRKQGAYR
jgi:hypothetical protein